MSKKACAITFIGFEAVAAQEIKELIGAKAVLHKGVITFSASDKELARLCYKAQSLKRVMRLFGTFSFTNTDNWKKQTHALLKKTDCSVFSKRSFKAVCFRFGKHHFVSNDIAALYGEAILAVEKNTKVDLSDPDFLASCVIIDNESYIGLDFAGVDLSKREYKIYGHSSTLNASFAYCALRFSGFHGTESMVDPLCGVGTIPLEAGLFAAQISPRFYQKDIFSFHHFLEIDMNQFDTDLDKSKNISIVGYDQQLRHVTAANKMAKLAGVHKIVSFSRADIEWLDTKLDEKSVDIIIAQPPVEGKALEVKDMEKLYQEFFYQVSFVLATKGKIVLLCQKTALVRKMCEGFTIVDEHIAMQGQQKFTLVVMEKK
jgi:23S rRNA G2445 N2-methylase RlmL